MPTPADLEAKLWKSLKSDRTVMLRLTGDAGGAAQPMTVQLRGDGAGPLYIFTAKDSDLVGAMGQRSAAQMVFAAKGHDLFATLEGDLSLENDPALIEALWNPFVAAWFEGGQNDPNLQLLRFDAEEAHVWENENSLFSGLRLLLGSDPKKDYQDKTADLRLQ